MRAVENGWYWITGSIQGNFGEKYHGGNALGHYGKPYGKEYRLPVADECLDMLAHHLRITRKDAFVERAKLLDTTGGNKDVAKAMFEKFVELQKERWKKEADACRETHELVVYGDPWEAK